ncbi:MAG: OmpH family outer membrane protein [Proteobacteria bacterium]|nr:OmpH family outer membrane protein [Pseudomonadota bacterium]
MKNLLPAALGALAAVAFAGAAQAQAAAPAAAPAGTPINFGPAIPGLCVLNKQAVVFGSAVGQSVQRRMQDLGKSVEAELTPENNALNTEKAQLEAQVATFNQNHVEPDQAFITRYQSFQQRGQAFEAKREQRTAELRETLNKQTSRIAEQIEPLVPGVLTEKGCSLLLDSSTVIAGNPAMDVTQQLINRLNGKITTLSFDREHLDQRAGAAPAAPTAAAAAPRPAAAAPAPVKKKK